MAAEKKMHQVTQSWSPYDRLPGAAKSLLKRFWLRMGFSPEFASLARHEIDMLLLNLGCALSPAHQRKIRDLSRRTGLKVQLGSGNSSLAEWINIDCYPPPSKPGCEMLALNLRRGLPFADNSVVAIYSEHLFEHLSFQTVRNRILPECYRILTPGGHIRVGVPDGELYVRDCWAGYSGDKSQRPRPRNRTPMMELNDVARGFGHKYLYDYETLEFIFRGAGFTNPVRSSANKSDVCHFKNLDQTDPFRVAITVYIEGQRAYSD